jgi:hypothetical protein
MENLTRETLEKILEQSPFFMFDKQGPVGIVSIGAGELRMLEGEQVVVPCIRFQTVGGRIIAFCGRPELLMAIFDKSKEYLNDYKNGAITIDMEPEVIQDDNSVPEDIHVGSELHQEDTGQRD